jgi:hypothetical protein
MELIRLLIFLFAPNSWAACGDVDHSDHFGAVRDQGEVGWCAGFSSADLLGEYLGVKPPDELSAFDMTAAYLSPDRTMARARLQDPEVLRRLGKKPFDDLFVELIRLIDDKTYASLYGEYRGMPLSKREGSSASLTPFTLWLKGGYCLESRLPSQAVVGARTGPQWLRDSEVDSSGQYVFEEIRRLESRANVQGLPAEPRCEQTSFGLVPRLVDPHLQNAVTEMALKQVRRVIDEKCGARHPFTTPQIHALPYAPEKTQQVLASGRSLELTYDVISLLNPVKKEELRKLSPGATHSSVIEGMRKGPGGVCQYEIRNSWGAGCDLYDPKKIQECKAGVFWIDENELSKVAISTTDYL